MKNTIPNGVWPTMITPFTEDNQVDYEALERLVKWYIKKGIHGLFAVCQSSEMFCLSLEERLKIATFVKQKSDGYVPVIAVGSISRNIFEVASEIEMMATTDVDAVVLLTNQLADEGEGDEIWQKNTTRLLSLIPKQIILGLYECPYPYKRLLSPQLLSWLASTNRFYFLKDTSCSIMDMEHKIYAVKDTLLKIFNANSATILDSFKIGISGFSGVMANFHPELYVWLYQNWQTNPDMVNDLVDLLGVASLVERQLYPINAKYHMNLSGVSMSLNSRSCQKSNFSSSMQKEVEQLFSLVMKKKTELQV